MTDFHFLRPAWLLALLPLVLLYWELRRQRRLAGDWTEICDPELLPHLLIDAPVESVSRLLRPEWLLGAGILAILALAGPTWERLPSPAFRNDQSLVIVLDLSPAMDATDFSPSRVERARFKIADILHGRRDGQHALVVYGSDAFTVTPLTDDGETIVSQLGALSTALLPGEAGGHPESGLELARNLLRQAGLVHGDILLISSGTGAERAINTASGLRDQGLRISVLGAGTEAGGPIPGTRGGFRQDDSGNIWIPKLESAALRRLAEAGGGTYQPMTSDDGDFRALLSFFEESHSSGGAMGPSSMMLEQWQEYGPWLLIPVIPLAALAFRRGYLAALLLMVLVPLPEPASAAGWQDLFLTRDQQAQKVFDRGEYERAAELFENPAWKAAAQYRAEQAKRAANTLKDANSTDAIYNKGNALAKAGKLKDAIKAYDEVLKREPGHEDAKFNRKVVEEALKKQKPQQGSGDDQDSKKDEPQDSGESQQQPSNQSKNGQKPGDGQPSESDQQQSGQRDRNDEGQPQDDQSQPDQKKEAKDGASKPNEANDQDKEAGRQDEKSDDEARREAEQQARKAQQGKKGEPAKPEQAEATESDRPLSEDEQATAQWLQRIPDDPGGLLKRKFLYQYQQRQGRRAQP